MGAVDSNPVGRTKLAQFRQPYGKRTAALPELRKLVPAYIFRPPGRSGVPSVNLRRGNVKLHGTSKPVASAIATQKTMGDSKSPIIIWCGGLGK